MRTKKELEHLACSANGIILRLITLLEENYVYYSRDNYIAIADDWLKWHDREVTDEDAHRICREQTGSDF